MKISDIQGRTRLCNGVEMPWIGLGVYKMNSGKEVLGAVQHALDPGYRLIQLPYTNETGEGEAIKDSKINREEVFVTFKL